MHARSITLYLPGLLGPPVKHDGQIFRDLALDELELLLSRARCQRQQGQGFETELFTLFGYVDKADPPVAALTHLYDLGVAPEGVCLRADPVNLQADRDRVVMIGNQHLDVTMDEARQLAHEFNQLFGEDGLRLEVPVNKRWYLKMEKESPIQTTPLKQVIGQDIHHHLPQGSKAMHWHSILNETQMLFYGSQVNERRRQRGQAEINSLWFWGEGDLPRMPSARWQQVWSNDVLSQSLARLGNTEASSLPATAEEWLEQAQVSGEHLVVIEALAEALELNDIQRWRDMLETINEVWIQTLIMALKMNTITRIHLLTDNAKFEINARQLKHWWKRRRPMSALQ